MAERERTRERERAAPKSDRYERAIKYLVELRDRATTRAVVLKGQDIPWDETRQGRLKFFIAREIDDTNSVLKDWAVFLSDIKTHTGRHRHQGGMVIYVIEGEGYTEVDDVTLKWKAGDLLLLPFKTGGIDHKHYNTRPGESCLWMAFVYKPYMDEIGHFLEQKEASPDYK